jgi:hypothetical protein
MQCANLDLFGNVFVSWSTNDVTGVGSGSDKRLDDRVLSCTGTYDQNSHSQKFTNSISAAILAIIV